MGNHRPVRAAIIHPETASPAPVRILAPGVEALDVREFLEALAGQPARPRKRRGT